MDQDIGSTHDGKIFHPEFKSSPSKPDKKRYPITLFALIAASLPLYWYYALYNPFCYYSQLSDSGYYLGIADNLFRGHGFIDGTLDPPGPVITTQNGIAFVALGLMKMGISGTRPIYLALITINYFAFICSMFLVYRLALRYELNLTIALLVTANVVLSDNVFRVLTCPLNDGIYFLLSVAAILLILENNDKEKGWRYLLILLISMAASHFRLQAIIVLLSASFAYLLKKDFKRTAYYLLITAASFLSIYLFYQVAITDLSGINFIVELSKKAMSSPFRIIRGIFIQGLPVLFLKFGDGSTAKFVVYTVPLFVAAGAAILYACAVLMWDGRFKHAFISAMILGNIGMLFTSPGEISFRYLILNFPLLLIVWGIFKKDGKLGGRLLAGYLIYSLLIIATRIFWVDAKHLPMKTHQVESTWFGDKVVLISQNPRFTYIVFSHPGRHVGDIPSNGKCYTIFGTEDYIKQQLAILQRKITIHDTVYSGKYWYAQGVISTLVHVVR